MVLFMNVFLLHFGKWTPSRVRGKALAVVPLPKPIHKSHLQCGKHVCHLARFCATQTAANRSRAANNSEHACVLLLKCMLAIKIFAFFYALDSLASCHIRNRVSSAVSAQIITGCACRDTHASWCSELACVLLQPGGEHVSGKFCRRLKVKCPSMQWA